MSAISAPHATAPRTTARTALAGILADAGRGALLLPRAFATIGSALIRRQPHRGRVLTHGLFLVPLGLVALLPVGTEVLFVLRGVLYGLVDQGPYNHSWGGPTRAGAWAAHFSIAVPFAVAGLLILAGLQRLATRLARRIHGEKVGAWPYAVVLAATVGGAVLFRAWLHQI